MSVVVVEIYVRGRGLKEGIRILVSEVVGSCELLNLGFLENIRRFFKWRVIYFSFSLNVLKNLYIWMFSCIYICKDFF